MLADEQSPYINFYPNTPIAIVLIIFGIILLMSAILLTTYKPFQSTFTGCDISKYTEQCLSKLLPYYNPSV
jgi:hypothetical protein